MPTAMASKILLYFLPLHCRHQKIFGIFDQCNKLVKNAAVFFGIRRIERKIPLRRVEIGGARPSNSETHEKLRKKKSETGAEQFAPPSAEP